MRRFLILAFVLGTCVAGGPARARSLSVVDLLDAYLAGRFDEVVRTLDGDVDFGEILKQLRKDGPGWITAASPDTRARRELTAATFALEAARAGQWHEWKWTIRQPLMCAGAECYEPLNVVSWKAPPLLIEWACARFRQDATPRPIERWWQLAALAVAQRSEDTQFMVGDPRIGLGAPAGEIGNLQDEIKHLDHIVPRFPAEMRFLLAQGIARDREWTDDALSVYGALRNDPDVGGEAMMRLGAMQLRQRRPAEALKQFELALKLTRDPYVVFLARVLHGEGTRIRAAERSRSRIPRRRGSRAARAVGDGGARRSARTRRPPRRGPAARRRHARGQPAAARSLAWLRARRRSVLAATDRAPARGDRPVTALTRGVVAVLAAGAALLQAQTQPPAAPVQTFRTGTDVVMVDVTVRDGGRMVTGLRAEDFVVTDNGVRQRIDSVESAAVPIDLTLVVDLSGNPQGPWERRVAASSVTRQLESEVNDVARILRPEDRVRLMAIDTQIHQVFPMRSPAPPLRIDGSPAGGMSALFDGLAAALLQPVEPSRRHVVIARTKGLDTISSIDAQALRAVAERSDALFHLVLMETALDNDAAMRLFQCKLMGLCWPTRRWWVPFTRRLVFADPEHNGPRGLLADGETVAAGAEATGGGLHKASTFAEPTLRGTFRKTFEDFRRSYVLRYTPSAPQAGWHTIDVSVPASKCVLGARTPGISRRRKCGTHDGTGARPPSWNGSRISRPLTNAAHTDRSSKDCAGSRTRCRCCVTSRSPGIHGRPIPGGKQPSPWNWRSLRCTRRTPVRARPESRCSHGSAA